MVSCHFAFESPVEGVRTIREGAIVERKNAPPQRFYCFSGFLVARGRRGTVFRNGLLKFERLVSRVRVKNGSGQEETKDAGPISYGEFEIFR